MLRATQDIDIVVDLNESLLACFLAKLPPDNYSVDADTAREALASRSPFNIIDLCTGWKADIVVRKLRPFSVEELRRASTANIHGVDARVASAEDTVLSKLEWAAMGESERQLRDVAGIIEVQAGSLDLAYVEKWATELGVDELWRRALQLARSPE